MWRAVTSLVVGLALLGCAVEQPPGEPVPLLTSTTATGEAGCYTFQITTRLLADPTYGTVSAEYGMPVMWGKGYTGRRLESGDIVVRDVGGNVVATTGNAYTLGGGGLDHNGVSVFYACSYVTGEGK